MKNSLLTMKNITKNMKIKGWHNHRLVKNIQLITLFGLPIWICVLWTNFTIQYFFLTLISIMLISKVGHSAGQHRYFCHRSFVTGSAREWVLALLATLCTTYSALHYAAVHRWHHKQSDSDLDPHTPKLYGLLRTFLGFTHPENTKNIPGSIIKDLLKNKPAVFFHNWYWPTIFTYWLILSIINPVLIIFCYLIPVGYTQFVNGTQTFFGHKWGYKNYNTNDDSSNNTFWNILTLGEGLHNNHHYKPYEYNFAWDKKPGEWDFTGWLINLCLRTK